MIYPPIIASFMPAFDRKKSVRIYFAISTYNSLGDIAQAQVSVHYQHNNANALNTSTYRNKIKCCSIVEVTPEEDQAIANTSARYYITLNPSDIITGNFDPDMIYKVQIRFSSRVWDQDASISELASTASEWSTVCLIKPIEIPSFSVVGLEDDAATTEEGEEAQIVLSTLEPDFIGVYIPGTLTETLKYWRMKLYDESGVTLLADSGQQTINSYEADNGRITFEARLKYTMSDSINYQLVFDIETKNGYTSSKSYVFTAMAMSSGGIEGTLQLTMNEEDGYAKVVLTGNGTTVAHENVTLRRTSSKSSFTIWEDIANKAFSNTTLNWEFDDFTIQAGVFYQYGAQIRDSRGRRSPMIKTTQEVSEFEDAYLTEKGQSLDNVVQLKIRYDMNIANTMVNVGEAKTDTIGSQYPFVRRNGNMYYHSFPFSFLITAYTDNTHIFATKNELTDGYANMYLGAHGGKALSVYNGQYDHVYQREFREKVEAFLYNDKVKLFRSLTEGNMLIKLMNITLTPKQQLGRLLYSVDATAVEIDEATIDKMNYYGIQIITDPSAVTTFGQTILGQLTRFENEWIINDRGEQELVTVEESYPAGFNIMGDTNTSSKIPTIKNACHYGESLNGLIVDSLYLSYLRIQIDSEPYLIKNVNDVLTPFDDIAPTSDEVNSETLLGTLIDINGTTILIEYPNNIYEMKGDNVRIDDKWSIKPLKDTQMTINYVANLSQSNSSAKEAATLIYKSLIGQLFGRFNSQDSIRNMIWYKYYIDLYQSTSIAKPYYLRLNSIYSLNLEAEPGVVLYVQSSTDSKARRMVIDETGELYLEPDVGSSFIQDAYFYGRNIENRRLRARGDSLPDDPVQFDSYTDAEGTHIYFNGNWYLGEPQDNNSSFDIACPVDGIVNYYIQTEKGIY